MAKDYFKNFVLDDLEEPVTPPVSEIDVLEPNMGLLVAAVILSLCL